MSESWDDLTDSAREALVRVAEILGDRAFSGKIEIDCHLGGVRQIEQFPAKRVWRPPKKAGQP